MMLKKTFIRLLKSIGLHHVIIRTFKRRQYKKIVNKISLGKPKTILDVGGGDGMLSSFIQDKLSDVDITILEKESCLAKKCFGMKFVEGDIENLNFNDNDFDLVICKDVLHHCRDKEKAVNELKRVGKTYLIIEARRGNKWMDDFLNEHHHMNDSEFQKIVNPENFYYIDVIWVKLRYMVFLAFSPIIPKSKKSFMIGASHELT